MALQFKAMFCIFRIFTDDGKSIVAIEGELRRWHVSLLLGQPRSLPDLDFASGIRNYDPVISKDNAAQGCTANRFTLHMYIEIEERDV